MEFLAKIHPEVIHFPIAFLLGYAGDFSEKRVSLQNRTFIVINWGVGVNRCSINREPGERCCSQSKQIRDIYFIQSDK